jgi:hypothetical protein
MKKRGRLHRLLLKNVRRKGRRSNRQYCEIIKEGLNKKGLNTHLRIFHF